jgi:hypothetical protein
VQLVSTGGGSSVWLEPRTHNRCTWAFAASACIGGLGVHLCLAGSIGFVALAGAGRVRKCCGIDCGIGWTASLDTNSGTSGC